MKHITESTLLPISLVGILIWAAIYVGIVANKVEGHEASISKLEEKQAVMNQIQTDIAVIKTKVETIEQRTRE